VAIRHYCAHCGHEVRPDARLCPNCGGLLYQTPPIPTSSAPQDGPETRAQASTIEAGAQGPPPRQARISQDGGWVRALWLWFLARTAKGRRSIKLPESALVSLRKHRETQLEKRERMAGLWEDHCLVFTTHVGTPISRQDLIHPLLQAALAARGTAEHSFPRPQTHVRHPAAG
jgi:hypothetical protein